MPGYNALPDGDDEPLRAAQAVAHDFIIDFIIKTARDPRLPGDDHSSLLQVTQANISGGLQLDVKKHLPQTGECRYRQGHLTLRAAALGVGNGTILTIDFRDDPRGDGVVTHFYHADGNGRLVSVTIRTPEYGQASVLTSIVGADEHGVDGQELSHEPIVGLTLAKGMLALAETQAPTTLH